MGNLYKLENGNLFSPPKSLVLEDGTTILNFHLVAKKYGYKELLSQSQPAYNVRYQHLKQTYEETDTHIIEKWQVVETISLEDYKQMKIALLDERYQQEVASKFESQGYIFSFERQAQEDFTQATAMFSLFPERTYTPWKTKNAGVINLTKEQYLQTLIDAENHKMQQLGKFWHLEHLVDICQSYEEVDNINWDNV